MRLLRVRSLMVLAISVSLYGAIAILSQRAAGSPTLVGTNVRVTKADLFPLDPFFSLVGGSPDVLGQSEPAIAVNPLDPSLIAVSMNDARLLDSTGDWWLSLAVSTNGGHSFDYEALVPGFLGDTSPEGLASPVQGNAAAVASTLGFDDQGHLFLSILAYQEAPPGKPGFKNTDASVLAVARYRVVGGQVIYEKTAEIETGTVGLGQQPAKDFLTVDSQPGSPYRGNIYVAWAQFDGSGGHLKAARSTDHGESYALSDVPAVQSMQGASLTVAPNGNVYLSWRTFDNNLKNTNPQDSAVFVARSTDGGATFGKPVRVAAFVDYVQQLAPTSFRTFSQTSLAADANGVYIAWQEADPVYGANIWISRSQDHGTTWEAPVNPHMLYGHQVMPTLMAGAGRLSVAWYDSRTEPTFDPVGPVTGYSPPNATDGTGSFGMDVYYNQADTTAPGPLSFGSEIRVTSQPFNPNLVGERLGRFAFIGDYLSLVVYASNAYVVWTDNRDINPSANAFEDIDPTTNPSALVNVRSRDQNIYFQKIQK